MVSMKDIARECNVSVATVSKALNGQPDIGPETRERIARKAEEMGYMANSVARALKTNRTYNIGVLFVNSRNGGLAHEFFSMVLDGIRERAEEAGYDITFINRNLGQKPGTYLQHCLYRGVDGVVVASADFTDPMILELVNSELPVVTIDHMFNGHVSVMSDNMKGMDALVRYVAAKGHRRLALIHGERTSVTQARLSGFYRACEKLGIGLNEDMILEGMYHDAEGCYELTKKILGQPKLPTCIFFPDDYSYIGGYNAIREAGLKVPDDISVVGYDGIPLSRILSPVLTTWQQNNGGLGRTAAERLIELIERPKTAILDRVIIHGSLQEGGSVAKLPDKKRK